MKSFTEYLVETKQTFDYRIKIAGDVDKDTINELEKKLAQFDVVKMTNPKTTPVMKTLPDFPQVENDRCTHMDVTFNYPATDPQIKQIAKLLNIDPNKMIIQQRDYADKLDQERAKYEAKPDSLLADTDLPAPDAEQKELSDDYSADPDKHSVVVKNEYKSDYTIAGGSTPKAKTTSDYPTQDKSPISGTNKIPSPEDV
jgi:phenolic acid decarboxylase